MAKHAHTFVDNYDGMVAFGFSREVDEKSLMFYLQKFSDDTMLGTLVPRLTDAEIEELFNLLSRLMRQHLAEEEYHGVFLKDDSHGDHHHHGSE